MIFFHQGMHKLMKNALLQNLPSAVAAPLLHAIVHASCIHPRCVDSLQRLKSLSLALQISRALDSRTLWKSRRLVAN
jgi:hypothetical protein